MVSSFVYTYVHRIVAASVAIDDCLHRLFVIQWSI